MDPHSPNKLLATKYCFLIPGDDTSFFFFISFFFGFLLFYVIISFYKNYFIIIYLFLLLFFSWKLFLFFRVPECSGMFRVPGFIDAYTKQTFGNRHYTIYVCATIWIFYKTCHWGWFFSLNFDTKKRSKIKHEQDRFFSMKCYKNQVKGMSGHTGQT